MKKEFLERIESGEMPSEILTDLMFEKNHICINEIIAFFIEKTIDEISMEESQMLVQDIYYAIWSWEKPDKRRKGGISSSEMDAIILKIIRSIYT